jgi:hypothetical protein
VYNGIIDKNSTVNNFDGEIKEYAPFPIEINLSVGLRLGIIEAG